MKMHPQTDYEDASSDLKNHTTKTWLRINLEYVHVFRMRPKIYLQNLNVFLYFPRIALIIYIIYYEMPKIKIAFYFPQD